MTLINDGDVRLVVKTSAVLTLVSLNARQIRQRLMFPDDVNVANVRIASLSPSPNTRMMATDNVVDDNATSGRTVRTTPVVTGAPGQNDEGSNGSQTHGLTLARPMRKRQR